MKVLVSAFDCGPGAGSETGAGWAWARAAAIEHDAFVMLRRHHEKEVRAALAAEPSLRFTPIFIGVPARVDKWLSRRKLALVAYYLIWQLLAWRRAKVLNRTERFDVGHHITFASDSWPAGIAWVAGLPVVWGPVGGSTRTVPDLYRWMDWRGKLEQWARDVVLSMIRSVSGNRVARRSALLVAINPDVVASFERMAPVVMEPNAALPVHPAGPQAPTDRPHWPKRAMYAGRMLPWKGIRLAVHTMAEEPARGWTLDFYGDGRERRAAKRLATNLGVEDRITFHGKRPRREVLAALSDADAFLFPSFHDSMSWAVGEAISVGCPVVCLKRGGPPVLVGDDGGIAVPPAPGVDLPRRLALALASIDGRLPPNQRWSETRLPALLRNWYERAASTRSRNSR